MPALPAPTGVSAGEPLPEALLLHLLGARAGQILQDDDFDGHLVLREVLAGEGDQLARRDPASRAEHDRGRRDLPEARVG